MVEQVRELVVRESPTHDKEACDALCSYLEEQFQAFGGRVKVHRQPKAGNHLAGGVCRPARAQAGSCCSDTTTRYTTSERWRRCRGANRRVVCYGPGVFDMKGGIAQIMFALRALQAVQGGLSRPVIVWLVSDEEEGSDSSRAVTEKLASQM